MSVVVVVVFENKFSFDVHVKLSNKSSPNGQSSHRITQTVIPKAACSKKGWKLEVFLAER
jgi:hypothetical protein